MVKILFFISVSLVGFNVCAQEPCGTNQYLEYLILKEPGILESYRQLQQEVTFEKKTNTVVSIPIVFHVIYNNQYENIPDSWLYDAAHTATLDYRRQNSDANQTGAYAYYQSPQGTYYQSYSNIAADCEIEFTVAAITRQSTPYTSFSVEQTPGNYNYGQDAWLVKDYYPSAYPSSTYLNIWVCNLNGFAGYTTFPLNTLPGQYDGIVMAYGAFDPNNMQLVRTLTHEIGHWLGLFHIFETSLNTNYVCSDDMVTDTYPQQSPNLGNCPNSNNWSSCPGYNVFFDGFNYYYYPYIPMNDNYMDYSNGYCLNFFSQGQKQRMWSYLNSYRSALISSIEDNNLAEKIIVYPNPAYEELVLQSELLSKNKPVFELLDITGKQVEVDFIYQKDKIIVNASLLTAGIYSLRLTIDGQQVNKKFVKMDH